MKDIDKDFGYVYLLFDGKYFKIGKTKNIKNRVKQIKSNNASLELIAYRDTYFISKFEKYLHYRYNKYRYTNEWFLINDFNDLSELWLSFSIYYKDFSNIASINFSSDIKIINQLKETLDIKKLENHILQYYDKCLLQNK